ncbi:hypothetical protein SDJN02_01770, partial [Cucurbita argyrosperma subsp. argyrosperma]
MHLENQCSSSSDHWPNRVVCFKTHIFHRRSKSIEKLSNDNIPQIMNGFGKKEKILLEPYFLRIRDLLYG